MAALNLTIKVSLLLATVLSPVYKNGQHDYLPSSKPVGHYFAYKRLAKLLLVTISRWGDVNVAEEKQRLLRYDHCWRINMKTLFIKRHNSDYPHPIWTHFSFSTSDVVLRIFSSLYFSDSIKPERSYEFYDYDYTMLRIPGVKQPG